MCFPPKKIQFRVHVKCNGLALQPTISLGLLQEMQFQSLNKKLTFSEEITPILRKDFPVSGNTRHTENIYNNNNKCMCVYI